MAGKSPTYEYDTLRAIFNYVGVTGDGITMGTTAATAATLYLALHTADPGVDGTQATNEISYTGYERAEVSRYGTDGWTVVGSKATLTSPIYFGTMTGGTGGVVTHFSVGDSLGNIYYFGPVTPNLDVNTGVTPILGTTTEINEA